MKQIVISDEAFDYLCQLAADVKALTGKQPTFEEVVDGLIRAKLWLARNYSSSWTQENSTGITCTTVSSSCANGLLVRLK